MTTVEEQTLLTRAFFEDIMYTKYGMRKFTRDETGRSYTDPIVAWAWVGFLEGSLSGAQRMKQT